MVDLTSIQTAIGGLKTASDTAQSLVALRDATALQSEVRNPGRHIGTFCDNAIRNFSTISLAVGTRSITAVHR